jgi:diaminopropionate ammonia-lyase
VAFIATLNDALSNAALPPQEAERAMPEAGCRSAVDDLSRWPVYAQTRLADLPGLAARLGIARLWVKDEGARRPLSSFKALGAAYALGEHIRDQIEAASGERPGYDAIWAGKHRAEAAKIHVSAASDGNHGRSLAWGAQALGAKCTVYLPHGVSDARADAIAEFGSTVIHVDGNYEDAIARVTSDSARDGMVMLQDTSFPGYVDHCRRIMQGYTLLAEEIMDAIPQGTPPTHLFVQIGCGGLAAAVAMASWRRYGAARPRLIAIEPSVADSLRRSIESGSAEIIAGEHPTIMIGMACGEVSMLAWDVLKTATHSVVAIDDDAAARAMRLAARGVDGDPTIEMGETGAAGLGALMAALDDAEAKAKLELGPDSRVVLLNTEAAIDRAAYDRILAAA